MRHYKKRGMKLGTDASHTKAIKRSLACALLANDRIKTTIERAKAIRGDVDRIITWAKRGDLAARRNAIARLGDASLVREVFEKAAQGLWADRNGGYTRIIKLGPRKGDNAEVVIIEVVTEAVQPKQAEPKVAKKAKAAPKKSVKKVAAESDATTDKTTATEPAAEAAETPEVTAPAEAEAKAEADEA